jgi:hypothetical protein
MVISQSSLLLPVNKHLLNNKHQLFKDKHQHKEQFKDKHKHQLFKLKPPDSEDVKVKTPQPKPQFKVKPDKPFKVKLDKPFKVKPPSNKQPDKPPLNPLHSQDLLITRLILRVLLSLALMPLLTSLLLP